MSMALPAPLADRTLEAPSCGRPQESGCPTASGWTAAALPSWSASSHATSSVSAFACRARAPSCLCRSHRQCRSPHQLREAVPVRASRCCLRCPGPLPLKLQLGVGLFNSTAARQTRPALPLNSSTNANTSRKKTVVFRARIVGCCIMKLSKLLMSRFDASIRR